MVGHDDIDGILAGRCKMNDEDDFKREALCKLHITSKSKEEIFTTAGSCRSHF
jgi:hypothetical protein